MKKLPYKDLKAKPDKTVYTESGIEFYYNHDYKLATRPVDESPGYREDELDKRVIDLLNEARKIYRYPYKHSIDVIIDMQNERSIERAIKYVEYRLLGRANYLDVFGDAAELEDNQIKHYKEQAEIRALIEETREQNRQTQQLLLNIALALNNLHIKTYK
ncbi:MAG: hypothetical protein RBR68_13535 [Tenuifilaceae bacterium]|nr:hypothetical protein [Tenuifilaceae bacterium]